MTDICNWPGKSGKSYQYWVYPLPHRFDNKDGNYIYVKIVNNEWVPIYMGEGDLGDRVGGSHHKADCIKRKGATHIHAHLNSLQVDRKREEKDLLDNFPQSYVPNGCNEKEGG